MSALMDALVAAGITAGAAARIAEAVRLQINASATTTATTEATPAAVETSASTALAVPGAATIAQGAAQFTAPVYVDRSLYSGGHAQFSGDNVFDGSVHLRGAVNWHGARQPANAVVTSMISQMSDGRVAFMQKQVAVLNDYGNAKPISMLSAVYAKTVDLVQHVVVTGVSFDAENCAVVASTTNIWTLTASTPGLTTTDYPLVYSMTANSSLGRLFMDEGITWSVT